MAEGDNIPAPSNDNMYFTSYEDLDIHELMLKDEPRTKAYQRFIEDNKALFVDKVVIDVGAGTGILSLFAAKAGARKVYAIEASGMSCLCEAIIAQNGYEDKITVLHSRAENAVLPNGEKADVLISEWMGFYLFHESMLNSVIAARDRLLKADGIMVPSSASLYLCPVSMQKFTSDKFLYWEKVYGFDFSPVLPYIKQKTMAEPQIETLTPEQCLAEPEMVANFELRYVDTQDLHKVTSHSDFKLTKNGLLHGFACWFEVEFEGNVDSSLDTGPKSAPTHWKQTVILLPDALLVTKGEDIQCSLRLEQSTDNPRRYNVCIEVPQEEESESEADIDAAEMIMSAMQSPDGAS